MLNQTLIIDTTLASLPELHPYFQDEDVTEIMVNPGGAVLAVEERHNDAPTRCQRS